LSFLEELLGESKKKLVFDVLACEAEVAVLRSGEVSVDLEENFDRDGGQGRRLRGYLAS
tara:strand:- start:1001 stop:1177 length:177 start_codon:yes stop_codon:yes gene_type:complete